MKYYHGSPERLEVGSVISPHPQYEANWSGTDFYGPLEVNRPAGMLAHNASVFMCARIDDIDLAGGSTDFIYEVHPFGDVCRHDLNWSSEISCLISEGHAPDSERVRLAAENYWNGVPHHDENVWEYTCKSLSVRALIEENSLDNIVMRSSRDIMAQNTEPDDSPGI